MPLSPSDNKPTELDSFNYKLPIPTTDNRKLSLVDRFQTVKAENIPCQIILGSKKLEEEIPSRFAIHDSHATPVKTPSKDAPYSTLRPLSSNVRNVEDLQAEIRRLHEQKLELIDKLSEMDTHLNQGNKSKNDPAFVDLQRQLFDKDDCISNLTSEKENLLTRLAEMKSAHLEESTNLRMIIEDGKNKNEVIHFSDEFHRIDKTSFEGSKKEGSVETHPRLSIIHNFEEERDALRRRLEDTQDHLNAVIKETRDKKEQFDTELEAFRSRLQHSKNNELSLMKEIENLNFLITSKTSDEIVNNLQSHLEQLQLENESLKMSREKDLKRIASEKSELENRILQFSKMISRKDLEIASLISQASPADQASSVNDIRFRLEHTIQRMSQLQNAYLKLHTSYEELREAKKHEEKYFLSKLNSLQSDNSRQVTQNQLIEDNVFLSAKIEEYKSCIEELNGRLTAKIENMDKLQDALNTISSLERELHSSRDSYQKQMKTLEDKIANMAREKMEFLRQSDTENLKSSQNGTLIREKPCAKELSALERDHRILGSQNINTSGSYDDISKRIRRLVASFQLLDATSPLNSALSLGNLLGITSQK